MKQLFFVCLAVFLTVTRFSTTVPENADCFQEAEYYLSNMLSQNISLSLDLSRFSNENQKLIRDICIERCFHPFTDIYSQACVEFIEKPYESQRIKRVFFDQQELSNICSKLNKTVAAMERCPFHELTTRIEKTWLRAFTFLCLESDYISHIECYKRAYEATDEMCNGPENCKKLRDELNVEWHRPWSPNSHGLAPFPVEYVTAGCEYARCRKDCRSQKVFEDCGQSGLNYLDDFYRVILRVAQHVVKTSTDYIGKHTLPDNCTTLGENSTSAANSTVIFVH